MAKRMASMSGTARANEAERHSRPQGARRGSTEVLSKCHTLPVNVGFADQTPRTPDTKCVTHAFSHNFHSHSGEAVAKHRLPTVVKADLHCAGRWRG